MTINRLLLSLGVVGLVATFAGAQPREPEMPYKYATYCHMCHRVETGIGPVGITRMVAKQGNSLHPEFIRNNVRFGLNAMPAFRKSEVSDRDLDEIVNYLARMAEYLQLTNVADAGKRRR